MRVAPRKFAFVISFLAAVVCTVYLMSGSTNVLGSTNGRYGSADTQGQLEMPVPGINASLAGRASDPLSRLLASDVADDPRGALNDALAIGNLARRKSAVRHVGAVWALHDPQAALAQLGNLDEDVRVDFQSAVITEWALIDPSGFLAHAESVDSIVGLTEGLEILIASDATRVWELMSRSDPWNTEETIRVYRAAMNAMISDDTLGAVSRIEAAVSGRDRELTLRYVGRVFGARDPDAAVAWASSLQPPSLNVISDVITSIAATDMIRAFDVATSVADGAAYGQSLAWAMAVVAGQSDQDPERLANLLVQRGNTNSASLLMTELIGIWAGREPAESAAWLIENWPNVTTESVRRAASQMVANQHFDVALSFADRMPEEVRDAWIAEIAGPFGRVNPERALEWVSQYQHRPGYIDALTNAIRFASGVEPEVTARFVTEAEVLPRPEAIVFIARNLASTDPVVAAEWALALDDAAASLVATNTVASSWSGTDPTGAQAWALELPRNTTRDQMLESILASGNLTDLNIPALLNGFTSVNRAQVSLQVAIDNAISRIASDARHVDVAEELAEYVSDVAVRRRIEESIAATAR